MKIELTDKEIQFLMKALVNNYAEDYEDFDSQNIADTGTVGFLIAKLVRTNAKGAYENFLKTRKERYLSAPVNLKLFMGSGNLSVVQKNLLHKRLAFAFSQLGAAEQNGGMGYPFDEQMDAKCTQDIKDVIKDMLTAFDLKAEDLK